MKILPTILLVLLAIVLPDTINAQEDKLLALQTEYQSARQKIEAAAVAEYSNSLSVAGAQLKQKGDLDNYLVLKTEQERLVVEKTVDAGTTNPNSLVASSAKKVIEARNGKIAVLLKQYIGQLDTILKQLMVADKIEDAKAVKAEKDKCNAELAVLASESPQPQAKPEVKKLDEKWISKDATYTVSSLVRNFPPLPSLLTCEGKLYGEGKDLCAFTTSEGDKDAHIIIDLGSLKTITKVYIENRNLNSGIASRAKTLTMWLSETQTFDMDKPIWKATEGQAEWTIPLQKPTKARFIRLGLRESNIFHLKQVKIFGQ